MRRKIMWLTFWITMVHWLGGLGGCAGPGGAENYKANNEPIDANYPATAPSGIDEAPTTDTGTNEPGIFDQLFGGIGSIFEPKSPLDENTQPVVDDTPATTTAQADDADNPAPSDAVEQADATDLSDQPVPKIENDDPAETQVVELPVPAVPPAVSDTEPSLTQGLDRSHWHRIDVSPAVGVTTHHPIYFRDVDLGRNETIVTNGRTTEARIAYATTGYKSRPLTLRNIVAIPLQPSKAAFDLATIPLQTLMGDWLWAEKHTPDLGHEDVDDKTEAVDDNDATSDAD